MRVIIVGLGVQGRKRLAVAGGDVAAVVDPVSAGASHRTLEDVPLASFDAEGAKPGILRYLLRHGKHVLVEKPLLADPDELRTLGALAQSAGVACYTAYNHRFEPHVVRLRDLLANDVLGEVYMARLFYGNGTAADVHRSPWRDQGMGVLADLGSHLLDLTRFLFGGRDADQFESWSVSRFENDAPDHVLFGSPARPVLALEATLASWRNTFTIDVIAERGSAHLDGLCKWGPSRFIVRRRVLPSGRPDESIDTVEMPDPTWRLEYEHFARLCQSGSVDRKSV